MEYICKMCGNLMVYTEDTGVCECEHCGSRQTVPTKYSDKQTELYNKACTLLFKNDAEEAEKLFLELCANVPDEADSYWGIVLCRCGVKYIDDPLSGLKIPFITRTYDSDVTSSSEYTHALEFATDEQARFYRREAAAIEMLRHEKIDRIGTNEKYDVFICCPAEEANGAAAEIYDQLCKEGLCVFFSPKTLSDLSEHQRELYANAAAANSSALLAVCTEPHNFAAAQFRREYEKCISAAHKDSQKQLILCVKDIPADSIPQELSAFPVHDISRIGFLTELIRCIKKSEHDTKVSHSVPHSRLNPDKLLSRMDGFLAEEDFEAAKEYSDLITDASPQCWQAHFTHFLACHSCRNSSELLLEEVVNDFASEYNEHFGTDVSDEDSFRRNLDTLFGSSIKNAVEYAEGDDKLKITTIYERLVSAVRDAVFQYEQEIIASEEKKELNELRQLRTKEEKTRKAAERLRKLLLKRRIFTFTAIIVAFLAFIAISFNFKWASVSIVVILIAAAVTIKHLDK